ncbi:hypothetical protein PSN45_001376 [Yamadazyma tenuis]|uniref:Rrn9 domain-containing protein n=1 Tax=Candida tenuis (strain ATCC 10573 / BCRC 21748 / CBS 615 / JCM 9827 / NBRC 10315 / NRRL Y-1498 / VKM Y-70) TaxID=590646 RepID=G3BCG4_CANTC|nr:uncharacterized protein CANTEDRAFT_137302 [Yamadazyma tenuis ATCC 10573]EGV60830.1 hypothetical protein CANTEDRAFT_137302 [Yamadazyma tenuis ATCC 10573]WEJ93899.1 hypothetical protein PSN45_001376 [Yamadazyma tenuis]
MPETDISEYRRLLGSLEKSHRRDLATHLYSTALMHNLHPVFPYWRYTQWPLSVDRVPDPRTQFEYTDVANIRGIRFEPEVVQSAVEARFTRFTPNNLATEPVLPITRGSRKLRHGQTDAPPSRKRPVREVDSDDSSESEYFSAGADGGSEEESDGEVEELDWLDDEKGDENGDENGVEPNNNDSDEDETIGTLRVSDASDTDAEEESDSINPLRRIKFVQKRSDHNADLYLEMKALLERAISKKLNRMNLRKGQQMTTKMDTPATDQMAKCLAGKVDDLTRELAKLSHKDDTNPHRHGLFTWQDILISEQLIAKPTLPSTGSNEFYTKCEDMFLHMKYNYRLAGESENEEEDAPTNSSVNFSYYDYLQRLQHKKVTKKSNMTPEFILQQKQAVKEVAANKRKIFMELLAQKERDNTLSWNKGYNRDGVYKKGKRHFKAPKNDEEFPEFALQHGGLRIDEYEYLVDF